MEYRSENRKPEGIYFWWDYFLFNFYLADIMIKLVYRLFKFSYKSNTNQKKKNVKINLSITLIPIAFAILFIATGLIGVILANLSIRLI